MWTQDVTCGGPLRQKGHDCAHNSVLCSQCTQSAVGALWRLHCSVVHAQPRCVRASCMCRVRALCYASRCCASRRALRLAIHFILSFHSFISFFHFILSFHSFISFFHFILSFHFIHVPHSSTHGTCTHNVARNSTHTVTQPSFKTCCSAPFPLRARHAVCGAFSFCIPTCCSRALLARVRQSSSGLLLVVLVGARTGLDNPSKELEGAWRVTATIPSTSTSLPRTTSTHPSMYDSLRSSLRCWATVLALWAMNTDDA